MSWERGNKSSQPIVSTEIHNIWKQNRAPPTKHRNNEGLCQCWTLPHRRRRKKVLCSLIYLLEYIYSKVPSFSMRMPMSRGGWHADLCLGWRPVVRAALAAGSWETGGRHPNVITAAKLLSIKYKLQKYAPWGLPKMKTEAHLSGFSPVKQRSWSSPRMLAEILSLALMIHSRLQFDFCQVSVYQICLIKNKYVAVKLI